MSGRRRFLQHRVTVVGVLLVVAIAGVALVAPLWTADPIARDLEHGLSEAGAPLAPSEHGLLGTDALGRDVWARLVAGARTSLAIAALATALALALGLALGLVAGYAGGRTDELLMRFVDLVLAFPVILLAILLAAILRQTWLATSSAPVVITLAAVGWTTTARVIRGKAQLLARGEMVIAARALGASPARIIVRYLLPNVVGVVVVLAALAFAQNLIAESVLSYLGLGPPPPAATWGRMLFEGKTYYRTSPHLIAAPGIAILATVVAFNLVANGLRDVFDPRGART